MSDKLVYIKNSEEFDSLISKEKFVLVDFWATWCTPCTMIAPIMDEIANLYSDKITVAKVDIDNNQDLAIKYGIQSIPTVLFFKDNNIVAKEVGVKPLASFKKILDEQTA